MYTYGELLDDVNYLSRFGVETGCVGASRFGRLIPFVHMEGKGKPVLVTAGIHAREHVSSLFAIKQIYKFFSVTHVSELLALNGGNHDFSLWKANAAGVDLNVNFDAKWGEGKLNSRIAGSENFVGERAFSEPETLALAEFTKKIKPCLTLSYHAKGREIYYEFGQSGATLERDRDIAEYAASLTGFTLINGTRGSAGGYKDWCIQSLKIPSLTLELAPDDMEHPLPDCAIADDFEREPMLPEKLYLFVEQHGYI